ncbi:MAG: drug/metabolite transporter (DMT)-like permease [Gammaproteobacteria bacterium]|jgi:drug/metabolite transporter (DMT)-like permease
MDRRYLLHGAIPALGAACCFAGMAALVKLASVDASSQVLVFLRSAFGLLIVAPFALHRGRDFLTTTRTKTHILRALTSIGALSCFYFAVARIGLAEAILLNASSPLFIGIFAIFMLGEQLERRAIYALMLGFCGVVLLLKPGTDLFQLSATIGAFAGIFVAFAKIFIRQMADTEPVLRTVFYFGVYSSLFSAIPLIWFWETPASYSVGCMIIAAAFGTAGQTLLTYAFTHNRAARVAPFSYFTVVLGGLAGWLYWGELPDWISVAGGALVIAGCVTMMIRPHQASAWQEARRAPKHKS